MKKVYFLSGLGADKRVFDFVDFSTFKVKHIDWIQPRGNEAIEDYARRLLPQINTPRPILIGVSFGGIMAIEIGKLVDCERIVLVSSAQTRFDIPFYFRWIGRLNINSLMSTKLFKNVNVLTYWFFGAKTKREKGLLREIILDTDDNFLRWAVDKIVNWRNEIHLKEICHIHGDTDRVLPIKTANFTIRGGGHLMIVGNGDEIGQIITNTLSS